MATTIESQTAPVRGQPNSADQRVADDPLTAQYGGWHRPWLVS